MPTQQTIQQLDIFADSRDVMLRNDVLEGVGLVPWRTVIEQRLGQQIAATVRGSGVSWKIGRHRGVPIG